MTTIGILLAVFSAIAGIVGASYSTAAQQQANSMNQKLNEENREDQQQFSQEAQQQSVRDTEYLYHSLYSPAAKVKQLQQAGLSVGMMYGQGGMGGSSAAAPMAATPSNAAPVMNPLMNMGMISEIGNLLNAGTNPIKTIAEAEKTKAEKNKTEEEILNLQKVREEINKNLAKADAEIKLIEEQTHTQQITQENLKWQNEILEIQKNYDSQTLTDRVNTCKESLNILIAQEEKCWEEINGLTIDNKYKGQLYHWQIEKLKAEEGKLIAEKALVEAQKLLTEWQQKNAEWQNVLLGQESDIKDEEKKQAEWNTKMTEQEYYKAKADAQILEEKLKEYKKYGAKIMESNGWAQTLVNLLVALGYKLDHDNSNGGL